MALLIQPCKTPYAFIVFAKIKIQFLTFSYVFVGDGLVDRNFKFANEIHR